MGSRALDLGLESEDPELRLARPPQHQAQSPCEGRRWGWVQLLRLCTSNAGGAGAGPLGGQGQIGCVNRGENERRQK